MYLNNTRWLYKYLLVVCLIGSAALAVTWYSTGNHTEVVFSSSAWQDTADPEVTADTRRAMLPSLLRDYLHEGMSRTAVIDLLGPPPDSVYFKEYDAVYWAGTEPGLFSIDNQWLVLTFDDNEQLTSIEIKTD